VLDDRASGSHDSVEAHWHGSAGEDAHCGARFRHSYGRPEFSFASRANWQHATGFNNKCFHFVLHNRPRHSPLWSWHRSSLRSAIALTSAAACQTPGILLALADRPNLATCANSMTPSSGCSSSQAIWFPTGLASPRTRTGTSSGCSSTLFFGSASWLSGWQSGRQRCRSINDGGPEVHGPGWIGTGIGAGNAEGRCQGPHARLSAVGEPALGT
jgi:hypothetical protein